MKTRKVFSLFLVFTMILLMTSCAADKKNEEAAAPDKKATASEENKEKLEEEPTKAPEEVKTRSEAPKEEKNIEEEVETVKADTKETAAEIGQWISTYRLANVIDGTSKLGKIRYRIVSISDDQEMIRPLAEAYLANEYKTFKAAIDMSDEFTLRLCDYEVYYPKKFPSHNRKTVGSPELTFDLVPEEGVLDRADGSFVVYTQCANVIDSTSVFKLDNTFQGRIVYSIPKNLIEQYYIRHTYFKEVEGESESFYTYVKVEEIKNE